MHRVSISIEDVESLQLQIGSMLKQARTEVEAAQVQYDEYPEKGTGRYMKALGRLEGLEKVNSLLTKLLEAP